MSFTQTTEKTEVVEEKQEFTRQEKLNRAARKMVIEPRGLNWFKFFKYFILPAEIVFSVISFILSIKISVDLFGILSDPDLLSAIHGDINGAIVTYVVVLIVSLIILVFNIIFAIKTFRGMSVLDLKGYETLSRYLIFILVTNIADQVMALIASNVMYAALTGDPVPGSEVVECIGGIVWTVVWFVLNKIYFDKRYDLFTDVYLREDDEKNKKKVIYSEAAVQNNLVECPHCHAQVSAKSMFCESCGENF